MPTLDWIGKDKVTGIRWVIGYLESVKMGNIRKVFNG